MQARQILNVAIKAIILSIGNAKKEAIQNLLKEMPEQSSKTNSEEK